MAVACLRKRHQKLDVGLLDYDKNHNHDYLTRLLAGHITNFFFMQI